MSSRAQVLLFGDQVVDKLPAVRNLYSISKTRPQLRRFLKEATDVVQCQLLTLTLFERRQFGQFSDLLELAEWYGKQEHPDEVCGATLITTAQIGEFLALAEDDVSILNNNHTGQPQNVYQLGFCVGLLAASVAASARDTSEIVKLGVEAVGISFRLGRELNRRSRLIQDTDKSWGVTLVGGKSPEDLQKRLDTFNKTLPVPKRAYLGIITGSWATAFAPPSTLELLDVSQEFADIAKSPLPAAIAVHASHLLPIDNDVIVGYSELLDAALASQTCVSSSTSSIFEARTLRELLHHIIDEISQHPLLMEKSIRELGTILKNTKGVETITLTTVGPTAHTGMVQQLLQQSIGADSNIKIRIGTSAKAAPSKSGDTVRGGSDLIAIVGMSGRFPQSNSLDEFWEALQAGTDTCQEIPLSHFPIDEYYDEHEERKNTTKTRFGCFLKDPGLFDNRLFNISPREAMQMDPLQRMLLMTTYEALEMAGYSADGAIDPSRVATYFGQTTEDWRTINDQQGCDTHYLPGSNRAFAPGRVNHYFKWGGGYYSIDTACSSSSTSVYLACNALLEREIEMGVVGGGSLLMLPELYSGLSRGGFLSATGGCKTYSNHADGYCRGEAVGVVVLKRLEDALRDNDNVLSVIRGAARNSNAGAGSITYPGEDAQVALFNKLLRQAGVNANEVGFIEMHGTGTQVGDTVEMNTVQRVFAQQRSRDNPLVIGAVKANVGHSEAAAGVVSIVKGVLMLQKEKSKIPPQPGYTDPGFTLNAKFPDLDAAHIKIADGSLELTAWAKGDGKRKMVINGFDAAGGNTSILIEDPPARSSVKHNADPRSHHVVATSARTVNSLAANQANLVEFLTANPDTDLADLAYTSTARRMQEVCRDVFVVDSVKDLVSKLEKSAGVSKPSSLATVKAPTTPLVFAFTGQSSQYTGMGSVLYNTSPRFRRTLDDYEALATHNGLGSFIEIIRGNQDVATATAVQTQLAIVALEIALANYWKSVGLQPGLVVGHSLGEYAALCVAEVLSVSDTLYLVHARAKLMQEKCEANTNGNKAGYSMLAVALASDSAQIKGISAKYPSLEVSCINGPASTVISGLVTELEALEAELKSSKIGATKLQVEYGFHSAQMDSILEEFEAVAKQIHFGKPAVPFVSTLTGALNEKFDAAYLAKQIRSPVQWVGAMKTSEDQGLIKNGSVVIEIGPHPVCLGLITSSLPDLEINSFSSLRRNQDDWKSISTTLAAAQQIKLPVDWHEVHKDYVEDLRLIDLPLYAFDLKDYWVSYQPQIQEVEVQTQQVSQPAQGFALGTTCLQRVDHISDDKSSATFLSNTSEPNLYKAIQGHIVDGMAICPAAVFADMAFTATKFLLAQNGIEKNPSALELINLNMTTPLVVSGINHEQVIRVTAEFDDDDFSSVSVVFYSSAGGSESENGTGAVLIVDDAEEESWKPEWSRMQRLVKGRVDDLVKSSSAGTGGHRMAKALVYKLFATLVDYESSYQALDSVYVGENFDDAAAHMCLTNLGDLGKFTFSPYSVDALVHLAGFILNGALNKPHDDLHIANHLGRMRVLGQLKDNRPLTCYTAIRERTDKGLSLCDVYVFDDTELVAFCTDIKFQKLTRSIFAALTGKDDILSAAGHQVVTHFASKSKKQSSRRRAKEYDSSASDDDEFESSGASDGGLSSDQTSIDTPGEDLCGLLLDLVAEKSGVAVEEMGSDDTSFTDIGIDSQMSISILTDFKKRVGMELPASFFTTYPTIGEVREELGGPAPVAAPAPVAKKAAAAPVAKKASPAPAPKKSARAAPAPKAKKAPAPAPKKQAAPAPAPAPAPAAQLSASLLKIVATEIGLEMDELSSPDTNFGDIGVDSMVSIKILSRFKKETGTELPASFFNNYQTVAELQEELDGPAPAAAVEPPTPAPQPKSKKPLVNGTTKAKPSAPKPAPKAAAPPKPEPESRTVLIQGKSRSTAAPLFLVTDGSGAVAAYIHLPALPGGRRIYALESPFLERPEDYTLTIQEMAQVFIKSIRAIQAKGPYYIGGWSAGSIYAYEICYQLAVVQGETIAGLMMMDMRVPHSVPDTDAEQVTMAFVEKTGAFTGVNRSANFLTGLSDKQKGHLTSTVRALIKYDPIPFPEGKKPLLSHVIWATKGLNDSPNKEEHDDRITGPAAMGPAGEGKALSDMSMDEFEIELKSWFFAKRYDFGTNGWENFLGDNIVLKTIDGDHFSMVAQPIVKDLGVIVLDAMDLYVKNEK